MDVQDRIKKVEGMEALRDAAISMADQGEDASVIRGFIDEGKKELAYEFPDDEKYRKATAAASKFKFGDQENF